VRIDCNTQLPWISERQIPLGGTSCSLWLLPDRLRSRVITA